MNYGKTAAVETAISFLANFEPTSNLFKPTTFKCYISSCVTVRCDLGLKFKLHSRIFIIVQFLGVHYFRDIDYIYLKRNALFWHFANNHENISILLNNVILGTGA